MIYVEYVLDGVENTMIIERDEFERWWRPHVEVIYVRHIKRAAVKAA